jgi:protein tyrosine/serine phosphatase
VKPVTENLWRGPRPKTVLDLHQFQAIVNLQSGTEDLITDSTYESERGEFPAVQVFEIKCSNIFPPTAAQVMRFLTIANQFKTYVHCHSGVDRTGFMVAVFRMLEQGWTFEQAHAEWVSEGRHWWFWWWKKSLKQWSKK